jgi:hypothetical protein
MFEAVRLNRMTAKGLSRAVDLLTGKAKDV